MPLSDGWWAFTVSVRRYESTVSNYAETGDFAELYAELPTSIHGEVSTVESTIAGNVGLGAQRMIWRLDDIDSEKGWPQEGDIIIYQGKAYEINKVEDHTAVPPMFSLRPHKVAHLSEELFSI